MLQQLKLIKTQLEVICSRFLTNYETSLYYDQENVVYRLTIEKYTDEFIEKYNKDHKEGEGDWIDPERYYFEMDWALIEKIKAKVEEVGLAFISHGKNYDNEYYIEIGDKE